MSNCQNDIKVNWRKILIIMNKLLREGYKEKKCREKIEKKEKTSKKKGEK